MSDWDDLNGLGFLEGVQLHGAPGPGRIDLHEHFRKLRWQPTSPNVPPGSIVVLEEGQFLLPKWFPVPGWNEADDARHFAYIIYFSHLGNPDEYHAWEIAKLRRDHENETTTELDSRPWKFPNGSTYKDIIQVIYSGKFSSPVRNRNENAEHYRPQPDDLCGFMLVGWEHPGIGRRTDVKPWRWGDLAAGGPEPPPPGPEPPIEPPTPEPGSSLVTGTFTGRVFRS